MSSHILQGNNITDLVQTIFSAYNSNENNLLGKNHNLELLKYIFDKIVFNKINNKTGKESEKCKYY